MIKSKTRVDLVKVKDTIIQYNRVYVKYLLRLITEYEGRLSKVM